MRAAMRAAHQLEAALEAVFADVLQVPAEALTDGFSPDDCPQWDSLQHINLVVAIEERFRIRLEPEDVAEMLNFGLVKMIVADRLER